MSSPRPAPDSDPAPDPEDPIPEARVAHAVAPYADLLPSEDLEALQSLTRRFLATHPIAAPLVDRLRPRTPPASSGEVDRRAPAALAEAAQRLTAKAASAAEGPTASAAAGPTASAAAGPRRGPTGRRGPTR
ncbi:uncharacterized protein SOCEGT47_046990 [Sorangium cellulosum]|uniref:Uncharacterized protein n=1 Tax=Sorangium cellulosum TaxID=56 RepID=A0A4V0NDX2_SORCE|nr:hypothetical protein [Sorangium cellulosum]AUX24162.1 uncharacterized protein SOCEGT47_046990 [Sorangium cellulosum]